MQTVVEDEKAMLQVQYPADVIATGDWVGLFELSEPSMKKYVVQTSAINKDGTVVIDLANTGVEPRVVDSSGAHPVLWQLRYFRSDAAVYALSANYRTYVPCGLSDPIEFHREEFSILEIVQEGQTLNVAYVALHTDFDIVVSAGDKVLTTQPATPKKLKNNVDLTLTAHNTEIKVQLVSRKTKHVLDEEVTTFI